ncbi:Glycosyl transferase family 2 [Crenothrix polyspora]|uniref:Glycosyl transferase family 2 n=1 Tax=Crenothrix polyspora TaxID=360316 RepID=A0A1R4H2A0_9GAMM|nr:TIGR04283 family arsenosugar biosynthesis glycosyltransferase [Crenothrix polyspora]SJM89969.1 Glycosyl transferase family 2 [Crenothrix polyspora]
MTFSIIIPTLNEAKNIRACLLALQPLRNQCEIIIADGGSTDTTRIRALPLVDKIILSPCGRAKQMNRGAMQATGDILIFLHADTYLPDNALITLEQQLAQSNTHWGRFDIRLDSQNIMLKIVAQLISWRSRCTGIATGDQAIFVARTTFFDIGGYPEIDLMEDIALCRMLKKISSPLCLTAKVSSSARRWEQFGITKTILLMWWLRLRYYLGAEPSELAKLYRAGQLWKT